MGALNRARWRVAFLGLYSLFFSEEGGGFCFPFPNLLLLLLREEGGSHARVTGASVLSREITPIFQNIAYCFFCISFGMQKI